MFRTQLWLSYCWDLRIFRFYYKIVSILFDTNSVPDTTKNLARKTQKAYNAKTSVFIWTLSI